MSSREIYLWKEKIDKKQDYIQLLRIQKLGQSNSGRKVVKQVSENVSANVNDDTDSERIIVKISLDLPKPWNLYVAKKFSITVTFFESETFKWASW